MSLQHWAIEAAWRNKNDRTVPGTSRHIIHELENNLSVARDGVRSFNLLLDTCSNCLNSIIDLLNNDEPNVLSKIEKFTELQKLPDWEDSVSHSSSLSRSSHQSSESIKMELNFNKSERKVLNSEQPTRENLHPIESKHDFSNQLENLGKLENPEKPTHHTEPTYPKESEQPGSDQILTDAITEDVNINKSGFEPGTPHSSPRSSSESPAIKFNTSVAHKETESLTVPFSASPSNRIVPERKSVSVAKSFRFQSSPKVEPTRIVSAPPRLLEELPNQLKEPLTTEQKTTKRFSKTRTEEYSEIDLSPIQLQPRTTLNTSPHGNSLFVPLKEINNGKTTPAARNLSINESDSEEDDSFQAISTAIRKSFAGNASMHNASNISAFRSERERETTASLSLHHLDSRTVKIEPTGQTIVQNTLSIKSSSRRTMDSSKRMSVFVSLPDREPISFRNSIRVKLEAADELLKPDTLKEPKEREKEVLREKPIERTEPHSPKKVEKPPQSQQHQKPKKAERLENLKQAEREEMSERAERVEKIGNGSNSSQLKQVFSQIGNVSLSSRPNLFPGPRSPNKNGLAPINKQKNRTAANGSPRRLEPPEVKPTNLFSGSKPAIAKRSSPDKFRTSPSKKSARSPTIPEKSQAARKPVFSPQRLPTLLASARADVRAEARAERARSKSAIIKNKFLVTKLNPKNPPTFVPSKVVESSLSLTSVASRSTFGYVPDLQRSPIERGKGVDLRKSEFSSNSVLNGKLDLTASENVDSKYTDRMNRSPRKTPKSKVSLATFNSNLSKVVPRRRPGGNAVPLPEAARGNFVRERDRERGDRLKDIEKTPQRRFGVKMENGRGIASPLLTNEGLPEIPSDDEELRNKKYLKSWAETPEIIRTLNENPPQDPKQIFGEFPVLKMSEVFSSISPSRSLDTP